ncbi:hypothetical protein [Nocardioides sp. GY 10127]|uniref:hypothetical protein n=1 Tax=Nocardioides sp. GY 10127 TaxID=2569762 RepID=UPI0010A927F5|nr:hypothetical protein [Nocardioides sp. GY 10127]TIC81675.1 hypothetical protein E8D37_10780 [Nocardioides sp. GY 10127]
MTTDPATPGITLDAAVAAVPLTRRLRRTLAPGLSVRAAWTWEADDRRDPAWWPQGVAALPSGRVLVSWYRKGGGVRVSVADPAAGRYAHVTVVDADGAPLGLHAGGLAVTGPWLHVAGTKAGFASLHADDLHADDLHADSPHADSGPDLTWQVRRTSGPITDADGSVLRVSFLEATADGVVLGEYARGADSRRLARVVLDDGATTGPARVLTAGPAGMQGAALAEDGACAVSTSHGPWVPGTLWLGRVGRVGTAGTAPASALRPRRWALPMGPEDLTRDAAGRLWCVTEHPHRRWLVRVAG